MVAAGETEFGLDFDGAFIGGQGFSGPERGFERPAQVVPELEVLRVQREGLAIDGNGPLEVAQFITGVAQAVIGVGRSRIELGCVPEPLFRFCFSTGVVQDKAQEIGHFTIRGCALEQIAAEDFSLRVVSLSARVSRGL